MTGRSVAGALAKLLFFVAAVAGVGYAFRREQEAERLRFQAQETVRLAARARKAAAWGALAAAGDLGRSLAVCREAWEGELSLHYDPVAIAYTRDELTAYFVAGVDVDSLRQVRCDSGGVRRGERVVHPLRGRLPAEAPKPSRREDAASGEDASEWPSELRRLASQPLAAGEDGVELLADTFRDRVLERRWVKTPNGARPVLAPADAPAFPQLAPSARLVPEPGKAPAALEALRGHDWLAEPDAALALVAASLPAGAKVSELTLERDSLDLQIAASTPAFDGKPPVPWGEKRFDEYGVADTDWWYPREIPGFGCHDGQTIAAVQAAFASARAGRGPLTTAWYSCSTAYSDGRNGSWHLLPKR